MKVFFIVLLFFNMLLASDGCNPIISKKDFPIETINKILSQPNSDYCRPLQVGSLKNFSISRKDSPTTVPHKYQLERINESEYKIKFNIVFKDDPKTKIYSTKARAYSFVWRKFANECLAKLGNKIKGPNGEILKLEVEESVDISTVPQIVVNLKDAGRAHSREWIKDMPCATVVHELLHVTGLVDEYEEKQIGIKLNPKTGKYSYVKVDADLPAYDCRVWAQSPAIMSSQEEKWRQVFAPWQAKTSLCVCGEIESICKEYFEERKKLYEPYSLGKEGPIMELPVELRKFPSECANGFKMYPGIESTSNIYEDEKNNTYMGAVLDLPKDLPSNFWDNKIIIQHFQKRTDSEMGSILDEKHWNAIIYPGCYAKNQAYYKESLNAYRTSMSHGGKGCL